MVEDIFFTFATFNLLSFMLFLFGSELFIDFFFGFAFAGTLLDGTYGNEKAKRL